MTEEDLVKTLLVRAIDERDPSLFSNEQVESAESEAGDVTGGAQWVQRRADCLFAFIPEELRLAARVPRISLKALLLASVPAFAVGVASNFLGPPTSFHILYNPLVALVLWNVVMLSAFIGWTLSSLLRPKGQAVKAAQNKGTAKGSGTSIEWVGGAALRSVMSLRDRLWASVWVRMHRATGRTGDTGKAVTSMSDIMKGFWKHYGTCCGSRASARAKVILHVAALALLGGAIVGVYVRGVFFEYVVVWKSTFIRDPEVVGVLLNAMLGLPSRIVTGAPVTMSQVRELMSAHGSPAAPWIHVLTVAALCFAFLPRLLLLSVEAVTLRTRSLRAVMPPYDAYFAEVTRRAWEKKVSALREDLTSILTAETLKFSESVASYVRDELYNRSIVPRLADFRDQGGRIADLEAEITASCKEFEKPLEGYIAAMQKELEAAASARITTLMGRQLSGPHLDVEHGAVHSAAAEASILRGEDLTDTFAEVIHMTITTVITGTVAAMSGGFGKTLGIAVVSVLLHTSGPVGWLIGAIVGLLIAGGVSWAAKDKISDAVKDYPMPSFVTRKILSSERLADKVEEGRAKIYRDVQSEVQKQLSETAEKLKEPLLAQMVEILKARGRDPVQ
jgi:hypothetical protein